MTYQLTSEDRQYIEEYDKSALRGYYSSITIETMIERYRNKKGIKDVIAYLESKGCNFYQECVAHYSKQLYNSHPMRMAHEQTDLILTGLKNNKINISETELIKWIGVDFFNRNIKTSHNKVELCKHLSQTEENLCVLIKSLEDFKRYHSFDMDYQQKIKKYFDKSTWKDKAFFSTYQSQIEGFYADLASKDDYLNCNTGFYCNYILNLNKYSINKKLSTKDLINNIHVDLNIFKTKLFKNNELKIVDMQISQSDRFFYKLMFYFDNQSKMNIFMQHLPAMLNDILAIESLQYEDKKNIIEVIVEKNYLQMKIDQNCQSDLDINSKMKRKI